MKQKRFSEERIIKILREAEIPGVSIGEVCRRNNITDGAAFAAAGARLHADRRVIVDEGAARLAWTHTQQNPF